MIEVRVFATLRIGREKIMMMDEKEFSCAGCPSAALCKGKCEETGKESEE